MDLCPGDALSSARLRPSPDTRLCHRVPGCRRLFTDWPFQARRPGSRPRVPLPLGTRFSEPRRRLPTSATSIRRAGTPDEPSILARERSSRSSTRRHQPMPVALAFSMRFRAEGPASHDLHEAGRGPKRSSEGDARFANDIRVCPPRDAPGTRVAGTIVRGVRKIPRTTSPRPRSTSDAASRKATPSGESRCLLPQRNPYATEWVTPSCAPGPRPRHAASVEALLGGSRAFCAASPPPASDEESNGGGSTRQAPVAEAPANW